MNSGMANGKAQSLRSASSQRRCVLFILPSFLLSKGRPSDWTQAAALEQQVTTEVEAKCGGGRAEGAPGSRGYRDIPAVTLKCVLRNSFYVKGKWVSPFLRPWIFERVSYYWELKLGSSMNQTFSWSKRQGSGTKSFCGIYFRGKLIEKSYYYYFFKILFI